MVLIFIQVLKCVTGINLSLKRVILKHILNQTIPKVNRPKVFTSGKCGSILKLHISQLFVGFVVPMCPCKLNDFSDHMILKSINLQIAVFCVGHRQVSCDVHINFLFVRNAESFVRSLVSHAALQIVCQYRDLLNHC